VEDQELLAAIGQVVVDAAVLEYLVAVLVAVIEGQGEEYAQKLTARPGKVMSQLRTVVRERPDRNDLKLVWHDAQAVLNDRHVIAHSVALEYVEVNGQLAQVIWHPRSGRETQITAAQVLGHVQDIRIATRRVQKVIAAEAGVG
jgi:ABC-type arginine transport system permease subunit